MNRITRFLLILPLALAACDSAEPDPIGAGEHELITQITLTLTNTDDPEDVAGIVASDPSGTGLEFTLDPAALALRAGASYAGTIELADTLNDEDITEEVRAEAEAHQLFYTVDGLGGVTIAYADEDANGLPVGLAFEVTVAEGAAGSGTLRVQLAHYDDGAKDGTTLSSETDVDLTLPLVIGG